MTALPIEVTQHGGSGDEALEILVAMARRREVDPWNVDIVDVADRYLKAITELKGSDLQVTGKSLLYLAILLRMKSDLLAGLNPFENPEEHAEGWEEAFEEEVEPQKPSNKPLFIQSLEQMLLRRTSVKKKRIRRVTLKDLIGELKKIERQEKTKSVTDKINKTNRRRAARDYSDFTADDIVEMAHEESLEDVVDMLQAYLEQNFGAQARIGLETLQARPGFDRVSAFLSMLTLSVRGEISLSQDDFYGELYAGPPEDDNWREPEPSDTETSGTPPTNPAEGKPHSKPKTINAKTA